MCADELLFHASCEDIGAAVVVHVTGELDVRTADELSDCLGGAVRSVDPPASVVVDLTSVDFLGACGIGLLLDHRDLCRSKGSAFVVVANTSVVLRPLQVLDLTGPLGVRSCVPDALASPEVSDLV
ncbi:STAS domain-containing protein [Lentzea nigeriaca]|uniref:STAS domain-containing protein n=1 Tax=Lentzea nigeriaca TaxID=1128665 RepID=UPI00195B3628|nr:STAS domain-containing protein [Lentzea nigeriaca]MBM7858936.1 anti-sigma B factor antagonist [Lentzea nigeriaca]